MRSRSARIWSNASPWVGGWGGSWERISPGCTRERTGKALNAGLVVGDPVDDGVAVAAEFFGRHVERFGFRHGNQAFCNLRFVIGNLKPTRLSTRHKLPIKTLQMSVIHAGLVLEFYFAVLGMGANDSLQLLHHWSIVGVAFERRVGR